MMKNIIAIVVVLLAILGVYRFFQQPSSVAPQEAKKQVITEKPSPKLATENNLIKKQRVLFVPYWHSVIDSQTKNNYDTFVYFGLSVDKSGSIKKDDGYSNLEDFTAATVGKKQLLTLRMLDTDTNHAILEDPSKQEQIIDQLKPLIHEYNFDGIVLDLEVSSLPLTDVRNNISLFIERVANSIHKENKYFAVTMYGDAYYRARPYDLKTIGQSVDEVMIMAYDFHKPRGEAGPNFPLSDRPKYGYDFDAMIADFTKDVSAKKLTVLMGMYGYDWTLGPQGKPLKAARSLPLNDIESMIEPSCDLKNCKIARDPKTKEPMVSYVDEDGYTHTLWYEDDDSVKVKTIYLEQKGIRSVGYWVYGYF